MKIAALIVEYNPLHNGHLYQIKAARNLVGPNGAIIAFMSGSVCQRGEIACLNKFQRARLAIDLGVDLVFELPTLGVLASAEYFAATAVNLCLSLQLCDYLICGTETNDYKLLNTLAKAAATLELHKNQAAEPNLSQQLQAAYKKGWSYGQAMSAILADYVRIEPETVSNLFKGSNNTLAFAYAKALSLAQAKIQANEAPLSKFTPTYKFPKIHFLKRQLGANYQSAHAIRATIEQAANQPARLFQALKDYLPAAALTLILNASQKQQLITEKELAPLYLHEVLRQNAIGESLETSFAPFAPFAPLWQQSAHFDQLLQAEKPVQAFIDLGKHKQIKSASLKRQALLQLLNLPKLNHERLKHLTTHPQYLRVLAFNKRQGRYCLRQLRKSATIPVIMRFSDFYQRHDYATNRADFELMATADWRACNLLALLSHDVSALDKRQRLLPLKPLII